MMNSVDLVEVLLAWHLLKIKINLQVSSSLDLTSACPNENVVFGATAGVKP